MESDEDMATIDHEHIGITNIPTDLKFGGSPVEVQISELPRSPSDAIEMAAGIAQSMRSSGLFPGISEAEMQSLQTVIEEHLMRLWAAHRVARSLSRTTSKSLRALRSTLKKMSEFRGERIDG